MAAVNPRNPAAWDPADPSIQEQGDDELGAARLVLLAAWLSNARYLRKYLSEFFFTLRPILSQKERYLKDDTGMVSSSRKMLTKKVQRELGPILSHMDADFRTRLRAAIERAARAQVVYLRAQGIVTPVKANLDSIVENALLAIDRDFPPGTGVTYMNRLERINADHQQTLSKILNGTYRHKAEEEITSGVRTTLTHHRFGRTPIAGGSATKKTMGLFVAEQARITNDVETEIMRASGIELAYWRLSPAHPWYGGSEICEVLAAYENPDIDRYLNQNPETRSGISLSGLHRISDWPAYPHPWCKCYAEPLIR